ncbi:MAG: mechanosensitive ion channel family protein [Desulfofustis sp.]|nr:mechanosensitive ion channel family protein [Desulfofustis sp.]
MLNYNWNLVFFFFISLPLILVESVFALSETAPDAASSYASRFFQPLLETLPKNPWFQSIFVILCTFLLASLFTWLVFRLLTKIVMKTSFDLDDKILGIFHAPVYYSVLVLGLSAGLGLMPLPDSWEVIMQRCLLTIGAIIWMIFFFRFSTLVLNRFALLSGRFPIIERRTVTLFDNFAKIAIFGAATYAVFVIWKIDLTAWLASAGIIGIAVGFAAKDTLSNLFSGVFILADAPYKVGDYIVLDRGDRGKVTHIGLRSSRILTRDDIEITIPNSIIGNTTIINQSGGPHEKMRVRLKIGAAYGSDVDQVKAILQKVAENEPMVCKSPEPRVRFRIFGASSLDFELLFWVDNPELRGRVLDAMNTKVYKAFQEHGVEIPYAKQDLYIRGLPESLAGRKEHLPAAEDDRKG